MNVKTFNRSIEMLLFLEDIKGGNSNQWSIIMQKGNHMQIRKEEKTQMHILKG